MKQNTPWWMAGAVILSLVVGAIAGFALGDYFGPYPGTIHASPDASRPTLTPPPSPFAVPRTQVLLLGVDGLNSSQAHLDAVWVLTYQPGQTPIYLLGLPPHTQVTLPGRSPMRLADVFQFSANQGGDPALLTQAMTSLVPGFTPRATVMIDREGIRHLIALRGGVLIDDRTVPADEALRRLDDSTNDPMGNLQLQATILQAVLNSYDGITLEGEVMPMVIALEDLIHSNTSIPELAATFLPARGNDFHVAPVRSNYSLTTLPDGSLAVVLEN